MQLDRRPPPLPPVRHRAVLLALAVAAVVVASLAPMAASAPASAVPAGTPWGPTRFCDVPPGPAAGATTSGGFHAVTPARLLDTRESGGALPGGCAQAIDLSTAVPGSATAVALTVVAVDPERDGYVTAFTCEGGRPTASHLNPRAGDIVSNLVTVAVPAGRQVCVYSNVATDLVVDLHGWFGPGGDAFHGVGPTRVLDSRTGPRPDGGTGPIERGQTVRVPVAGTLGVPADATAVAVNLTVDAASDAGFLTAFPCGTRPPTSSLNHRAGDTRATQAIVALDGTGALCVYSLARTELVIDVSGAFAGRSGDRFVALATTRVVDTRDGTNVRPGPLVADEVVAFDPTLGGAVPVGAGAVLDIVATETEGPGWLAAWSCETGWSLSSTANFGPDDTVANVATVPIGTGGLVCLRASAGTHVVVDVEGSFGRAGGLRHLSVAGRPLLPAFTPDGHDYGVACAPGANTWSIDAVGSPGTIVALDGGPVHGVTVAEGDAIRITVARIGAAAETYVVRCLPHDFPTLQVDRDDDNAPGWYLISPGFQAAGQGSFAAILDEHGGVVWYRRTPAPVIDLKRLPDGNLGWTRVLGPTFGTDPQGAIEEHRLDGSLVRTWATDGSPTDHHDFQPLPNGNMMLITYHQRTGVDVAALGGAYPSPTTVADAWIQEIRPDGTVAWEWRSEDHVGVAETVAQGDGLDITYPAGGGVTGIDLVHLNSIEVDPATGDVIASARHLDAVLRIRRDPGQVDDGRIVWKLGGAAPAELGADHLDVVDDPAGGPHRPHDARLLPDGNLTLFDNETVHAGFPSRAVEYRLDPEAGEATLVWTHDHPAGGQAFGLGSVRRQPDGATVISWGPLAPAIEEVDRWGNTTFVVTQLPGGFQYRAVKEPPGSFDRATLRAAAGGA